MRARASCRLGGTTPSLVVEGEDIAFWTFLKAYFHRALALKRRFVFLTNPVVPVFGPCFVYEAVAFLDVEKCR